MASWPAELPISPGTQVMQECFYLACPVLSMALGEAACATPWESLCGSVHRGWFMHTQHITHSVAHTFPSAKQQSYYFFSHLKKNVKLIKETNTFNETYVGHLEGEDLQRVCCETRRLTESVKSEDKDTRL